MSYSGGGDKTLIALKNVWQWNRCQIGSWETMLLWWITYQFPIFLDYEFIMNIMPLNISHSPTLLWSWLTRRCLTHFWNTPFDMRHFTHMCSSFDMRREFSKYALQNSLHRLHNFEKSHIENVLKVFGSTSSAVPYTENWWHIIFNTFVLLSITAYMTQIKYFCTVLCWCLIN